jgi:excisionase family DNA binding protein
LLALLGVAVMTAVTVLTERRAFFTPKTLAQYLAVSERTVRSMLAKGTIPSYLIEGSRRIDPADVDAYEERRAERVSEDDPLAAYRAILYRDPCSYCGADAEHIDHIVSRHRGGADEWDNLTASCARCNLDKRTRSLLAFVGYRYRLR